MSAVIPSPALAAPRWTAGNRLVVAPMAPNTAGVFTKIRPTGFYAANSQITASSREWMARVRHRLPFASSSMHFSQAMVQSGSM